MTRILESSIVNFSDDNKPTNVHNLKHEEMNPSNIKNIPPAVVLFMTTAKLCFKFLFLLVVMRISAFAWALCQIYSFFVLLFLVKIIYRYVN